jgi:anti-sigma B factor antagonist
MHRVDTEHRDGVVVISAGGELDAFAAPDLSAALSDDHGATSGRVIDLGSVSFLDSTALGVVVRAVRAASERGRETRVVLPRGSARRIFEITTLDRVLPLSPGLEEALAELTSAS